MEDSKTTQYPEFEFSCALPARSAMGTLVTYTNSAKNPNRANRPTGDTTMDAIISDVQPDPDWQQIESGSIVEVVATAWKRLEGEDNDWTRLEGKARLLPPFMVMKTDGMIRSSECSQLMAKPYFGSDYTEMKYVAELKRNIPEYVAEVIAEAAGLKIEKTDKAVQFSNEFYGFKVKFAIVRWAGPEDKDEFFEGYEKRLNAYIDVREQMEQAAKSHAAQDAPKERVAASKEEDREAYESLFETTAVPAQQPHSGNNGHVLAAAAKIPRIKTDTSRMKRFAGV